MTDHVLMFSNLLYVQCFPASSTELYQPLPLSSMSGWMGEMADLVDAAQTGVQAPPVTKAAPLQPTVAPSSIDDTPTETATSPRMIDLQARERAVEFQLPTREIGPREEPERYPTRFIVNDGQWTPEEHDKGALQSISSL